MLWLQYVVCDSIKSIFTKKKQKTSVLLSSLTLVCMKWVPGNHYIPGEHF